MTLPLEGIRVLDCTQWQQGPAATALFGDLGADVIKIERPFGGDAARGLSIVGGVPTMLDDWNLYFEVFNRSKRSISLDLKSEDGKRILYQLVEKSDVFVTNFMIGIPEQLGIDYEVLSGHNPKIIYVHASAYGPNGPEASTPGMDISFQARSGLMASIAETGNPPLDGPVGIADQTGAMATCCAVLAGLLVRERTGIGQRIDVSGLGSMIWLQQLTVGVSVMRGSVAPKRNRSQVENPLWNYYCCRDGKWIMLSMLQSDNHWDPFCKALGREELIHDPRFENASKRIENNNLLIKTLDETFMTNDRDTWMALFKEAGDLIFSAINTVEDLLIDPQVLANNYISDFDHPVHGTIKVVGAPLQFSKTHAELGLPAPELGQHTEQLLNEILGYTWEEITNLRERNII
ncbi:MAG: CoA transferase [Dehalococcoidales bacterium]|nr:CoA transferase [Dehalococcoidales bacterium]